MNCRDLNMTMAKRRKKRTTAARTKMVMGYFGLPLPSPKWMIKVNTNKNKEWPSGCAHLIVEEPEETFRHKDLFSKAKQKTKLGQLKYKKGQNRDMFSTAIGGLYVEYRNQLSKDDKIATLVSVVEPFR